MTIREGVRLELRDAGEGWFRGIGPSMAGTVQSVVHRPDASVPWYVVRLDEPLDMQESGHHTPSGFLLVRYSTVAIRSRWQGDDIGTGAGASVHVCVVPDDRDPVAHVASLAASHVWADCTVLEAEAG